MGGGFCPSILTSTKPSMYRMFFYPNVKQTSLAKWRFMMEIYVFSLLFAKCSIFGVKLSYDCLPFECVDNLLGILHQNQLKPVKSPQRSFFRGRSTA